MKTIYKYSFEVANELMLDLPEGAQVLSFQNQQEQPCIWALVDTDHVSKPRYFRVIGTGHPAHDIDSRYQFVGTAQFLSGSFLAHLFELKS